MNEGFKMLDAMSANRVDAAQFYHRGNTATLMAAKFRLLDKVGLIDFDLWRATHEFEGETLLNKGIIVSRVEDKWVVNMYKSPHGAIQTHFTDDELYLLGD